MILQDILKEYKCEELKLKADTLEDMVRIICKAKKSKVMAVDDLYRNK